MNCKPGDLACVVRLPDCAPNVRAALLSQLLGRFVRCVALVPGSASWKIETAILLRVPCGPLALDAQLTAIEDQFLQPVRGVPVHNEQLDEVPSC